VRPGRVHPLSTATDTTADRIPAVPEGTLREVIERLAPIERPPCSPGEREAAEWLAERLRAAGVDEIALEDEPSWGTFPPNATVLSAIGAVGSALTLAGRRALGGALSAAALAGLVDEIQNGPRIFRRAVRRERTTVNLVARLGDADAPRNLVVLAHHDAAQTGFMFDQTAVAAFHERFPAVIPNIKTQPPQWWGALAGPIGGIAAAVTGRRGPARAGLALGAVSAAVLGDMWRSRVVPGANDNLSAVGCLVALAEMLRDRPVDGLRVWLVSAGAEETLQDGIRAFMERHRDELPADRTWFLNLDTVGSPRLVLLEGEGPVWMEDFEEGFRDRVFGLAERHGLRFERGFRARASTDAVIPHRHGYPMASVSSVNDYHYLTHYHLPSDTPENLHWDTVAEATRLAYAVMADLGDT
jgi:Peptidase family M28